MKINYTDKKLHPGKIYGAMENEIPKRGVKTAFPVFILI